MSELLKSLAEMKLTVKQITNLFHVNFEVAALDVELDGWVSRSDFRENVLEHARNQSLGIGVVQTSALHGKRLS